VGNSVIHNLGGSGGVARPQPLKKKNAVWLGLKLPQAVGFPVKLALVETPMVTTKSFKIEIALKAL
jgi:hypothetical protein